MPALKFLPRHWRTARQSRCARDSWRIILSVALLVFILLAVLSASAQETTEHFNQQTHSPTMSSAMPLAAQHSILQGQPGDGLPADLRDIVLASSPPTSIQQLLIAMQRALTSGLMADKEFFRRGSLQNFIGFEARSTGPPPGFVQDPDDASFAAQGVFLDRTNSGTIEVHLEVTHAIDSGSSFGSSDHHSHKKHCDARSGASCTCYMHNIIDANTINGPYNPMPPFTNLTEIRRLFGALTEEASPSPQPQVEFGSLPIPHVFHAEIPVLRRGTADRKGLVVVHAFDKDQVISLSVIYKGTCK